ncbi:hypothetical protein NDU88_002287 [Pleurodeles waltl]|uniref:Uncharacterized protein n=1 Tax=Pleurodeles waltl TaxID=8319 RepID=A0AAV7MNY0_PLEWA|nr:hypothetical protein NDU88_002287 [Pleurodeles waltl]
MWQRDRAGRRPPAGSSNLPHSQPPQPPPQVLDGLLARSRTMRQQGGRVEKCPPAGSCNLLHSKAPHPPPRVPDRHLAKASEQKGGEVAGQGVVTGRARGPDSRSAPLQSCGTIL